MRSHSILVLAGLVCLTTAVMKNAWGQTCCTGGLSNAHCVLIDINTVSCQYCLSGWNGACWPTCDSITTAYANYYGSLYGSSIAGPVYQCAAGSGGKGCAQTGACDWYYWYFPDNIPNCQSDNYICDDCKDANCGMCVCLGEG